MEEHLLDSGPDKPSFTDAIVKCLSLSKANAFENLLEPLQKLLRLSPPIASTLARPDFFARISQKLHHNKAAVRLNLLRILSSICDSSEEQGGLLTQYELIDAITELQNDPAILVRDMAGKLIKSSERSEALNSAKRKPAARRRSTSTITPPGLLSSQSTPSTPSMSRSNQPKAFFDGRETPRHQRVGLNGSGLAALRPGSRDGSSPGFGYSNSGTPAAPRTRLNRGMSNRMSQVESLPEEPPRPSTSSGRRSSIVPSRRPRRPTIADTDWKSR